MSGSVLDREMRPLQCAVSGPSDAPAMTVAGEVDLSSVHILQTELTQLLDLGARSINLDFAGVGFIDSSGLGVLVAAMRRLQDDRGGRITISATQDSVRKVFEITGLAPMFGIRTS
jgi:anti-sigma B factor antagonist